MQRANEMRDHLIKEFTENYMEKLFYFCLKKAGSYTEAEDLTQDIALNILTALNKGTIPASFSAWIWQIARNRYSVWATKKHDHTLSVTGSDIGDHEIISDDPSVLDEMIQKEQLALLRRELAFIRSDYRNIVVAYYIESKSVREIAHALSLSESAVKQRLFRARLILKEGMDMAREFGVRSYKPENITFAASGLQPSGLPWKAVQRSIPKNILLQASNNPSTLEELSVELGIALPYMEEEVNMLHEATLLEKQGDKYITNFFILDKDCRIEIYHALRSGARVRSRLIKEFMDGKLDDIRALGIAGDHIDDNSIRWWLVPHLFNYLILKMIDIDHLKTRENGESWGFIGYETTELPERLTIGCNGYGQNLAFKVFKYDDYSMWKQCGEPGDTAAILMCDCIKNRRSISSLSENEKKVWLRINGRYAHMSDDGEIIPDILVMTSDTLKRIHKLFAEHETYKSLVQNITDAIAKIEKIYKKYSHEALHSNIEYNIGMALWDTIMMSVHDLVDDGVLILPEDTNKSTLGMHIILE